MFSQQCVCVCLLLPCAHTLWSGDISENLQETVAESKLKSNIAFFFFFPLPQPTFIIEIAIFSYGVYLNFSQHVKDSWHMGGGKYIIKNQAISSIRRFPKT